MTERVQQHFEVLLREEVEREQLTGIARDGRDQGLSSMAEFVSLVSRINASSSHLGKDDKFQLFVCLAARSVRQECHFMLELAGVGIRQLSY